MLLKGALKFLFASLALILVLHWYGAFLLQWLIPLFKWQIHLMDDQYQLIDLSIKNVGTEQAFSLHVSLAKPLILGGQFIVPDERGTATVSSSVAHVWQMVVIFLAMLVAWPVERYSDYWRRVAVGLPVLIIILMLDIPFSLLATLWRLILDRLSLEQFSSLLLWNDILESGGRLVLGLVGGLLTVWLSECVANIKVIPRQL